MPARRSWVVVLVAALSTLVAASAHADAPRLLADLTTTPLSSNPQALARAGALLLFVAEETSGVHALFSTDGTQVGTIRLATMTPLDVGNTDFIAASAGSLAFFVAGGDGDITLWRSDGTPAGTFVVRHFVDDLPWKLAAIDGRLFFHADGGGAQVLWTSDGTVAGTQPVPGVPPNPGSPVAAGAAVFFSATDAAGTELWRADGSEAGTHMVVDLVAGAGSSSPTSIVAVGAAVFFRTGPATLRYSDGTPAGTRTVYAVTGTSPVPLGSLQGRLIFRVSPGLWSSDGTPEHTAQFSTASVIGDKFVDAGALAFFTAVQRVWRTDGTAAGTFKVTTDAAGGTSVGEMVAAGGLLYYTATNPWGVVALYRSDGTAVGTFPLTGNGAPVPLTSSPAALTAFAGRVFLRAETGGERELWTSDGSGLGTTLAVDVSSGTADSAVRATTAVGAQLGFVQRTAAAGDTVWRSDGTAAGTSAVANGQAAIDELVSLGDDLYWSSSAGLVRDDGVPVFASPPANLARAGERLYFSAGTGDVFASDGTAAGTIEIAHISGPVTCLPIPIGCIALGSDARGFTQAGARAFFVADGSEDLQLWSTDGSAGGTAEVTAFAPSGTSDARGDAFIFTPLGERVVFPLLGRPWVSNGTAAGTVSLTDVAGLDPNADERELTRLGDVVYFAGSDSIAGRELWRTDGSAAGTWRVADIVPGIGGSQPLGLVALDDLLLFAATDADGDRELWRTDGTEAGTVRVADIAAGLTASEPEELAGGDGYAFFSAATPDAGREPWITDGTAAGTRMLGDLVPGAGGSDPADFAVAGGRVVFVARHPLAGREPWTWEIGCVVDVDDDGVCDHVDACPVGGAALASPRVSLKRLGPPAGDDKLAVRGAVTPLAPTDVDPSLTGFRLRVADTDETVVVDVTVPGGAPWKARGGRVWSYRSKAGPGGVQSIRVRQRRPGDPFDVKIAAKGTFATPAVDAGLRAAVDLAPGAPVAACGDTTFAAETCLRGGGGTQVTCR